MVQQRLGLIRFELGLRAGRRERGSARRHRFGPHVVARGIVGAALLSLPGAAAAPAGAIRDERPAVATQPIADAQRWPEADALFKKDARWLGADAAYSVDLGAGRILWLLGDSFIATKAPYSRRNAAFIRNSVGLQRGENPATAAMEFYWREVSGRPASYFPEEPGVWFWPGDGVRLGQTLLLFLMKVRATTTGLKFEAFDWTAVAIDNVDDEPARWHVRRLETPSNDFRAIVGSGAVLRSGDYVHAFGSYEGDGRHDVCLVRWPVAEAMHGELMQAEWWDAQRGAWIRQRDLRGRPAAVFTGGQAEFTVHFEPRWNGFLEVQTRGFGAADIAWRTAPSLTGPWSELTRLYRPDEITLPGVMIYAGKAHREQRGADLVLTYVVNAGWERVLDDMSLYYPRFVKVRLAASPAK